MFPAEEDFQLVQRSFLDRHYLEFEESDENKLSYTLIFNEYVSGSIMPLIGLALAASCL